MKMRLVVIERSQFSVLIFFFRTRVNYPNASWSFFAKIWWWTGRYFCFSPLFLLIFRFFFFSVQQIECNHRMEYLLFFCPLILDIPNLYFYLNFMSRYNDVHSIRAWRFIVLFNFKCVQRSKLHRLHTCTHRTPKLQMCVGFAGWILSPSLLHFAILFYHIIVQFSSSRIAESWNRKLEF